MSMMKCPKCNGTGKGRTEDQGTMKGYCTVCDSCCGRGWVSDEPTYPWPPHVCPHCGKTWSPIVVQMGNPEAED